MAGLGQIDRTANFFELVVVEKSLTPENQANYKDESNRTIRFSELPPQVQVQKDANYVDERVPGRSEPWKVYSDSGSTMIDWTAKLMATGESVKQFGVASAAVSVGGQVANRFGVDGLLGRIQTVGGQITDTVDMNRLLGTDKKRMEALQAAALDVHKRVAALFALTHAQYDDNNVAFPPPLVDVRYAQNFAFRGIVKSVRFSYLPPWEPETGMSMQVECQVTMEEVNLVPKSYRDVRERVFSVGLGKAGENETIVRTPKNLLGLAKSTFGL
jgi:hypothetical protein